MIMMMSTMTKRGITTKLQATRLYESCLVEDLNQICTTYSV